ncbi:hypothetical protein CYMTET_3869 [Cymbomonas tetramitiformis]|uniref:Uncharacterized protein n=1 Tax=Cymbomonas tetramitiformis TaxID=36881 RepID=A0AAE0H462_9CHLO|nr:hypothetical protein CYMTET_3869 [Cymbomonas tetramitiformis]
MGRKRYTGCVYADPPESTDLQNFMELSKKDLVSMRLVGLPLKVEHTGPSRGEIVEQHTDEDTGYTTVTFEIFDDYAGEALSRMISNGRLPDLSLCHNLYASADLPFQEWQKEPVEIVKMSAAQIGSEGALRPSSDPVQAASETAAGAPTPTAQGVHPVPSDFSNGVSQQRVRDKQVRFAPTSDSEGAPPAGATARAETDSPPPSSKGGLSDVADRIERIAQGLDSKVSNELVNTVGDILMAHVQAHEKLKTAESDSQRLRTKCETLEKDNENMRAERKAEFGRMAGDIADALSDIYMQYNGSPMDQSSKNELISELDRNPKIAKTFQGLPMATVAMSAQRQVTDMGNRMQQARAENANEKENALTKRLRDYQSQLSALQSAGASPQTNTPSAPSMTATETATPAIEVSASQQKYGQTYNMLPPALRDCIANYDASCGSGRMTPDDYNSDNLVKRQRT